MSKTANELKRHPLHANDELILLAMDWCYSAGKYSGLTSFVRHAISNKKLRTPRYKFLTDGYLEAKKEIADKVRAIIGSENAVVLSFQVNAFIEFDIKASEIHETENWVHYDKEQDLYTVEYGDDVPKGYEVDNDVVEDITDGEHTEESNM